MTRVGPGAGYKFIKKARRRNLVAQGAMMSKFGTRKGVRLRYTDTPWQDCGTVGSNPARALKEAIGKNDQ